MPLTLFKKMTQEFGQRYYSGEGDVYEYNSWDVLEWQPELLEQAKAVVASHRVSSSQRQLDDQVQPLSLHHQWNNFYMKNEANFFKDRHWFQTEFPELFRSQAAPSDSRDMEPLTILEFGCGVGNSIFPLLEAHRENPNFFIYGCDFSAKAIDIIKSDVRYDARKCHVFVHDLADNSPASIESLLQNIPANTIDVALLIFVLSAIYLENMPTVVKKLQLVLKKPDAASAKDGGSVFFRDYGLYDLAQLRLRPKNWISGNQYRRSGDQTLMYFFSLEELHDLFLGKATPNGPSFSLVQSKYDRRLLTNRKRKLLMYRVWVQAKFRLCESSQNV